MNKLLTFEGGQPFTIEDLSFLQSNFIDAMNNIVASLAGNVNCILTGIKESNTSAKPGAIYIDGNIYMLTKYVSGGGSKYYLCINQKETEQRMFRDSVSHNVYLVDDAYMSDAPSAVSIDMRTTVTLSEIVVEGRGLWTSIGPEFEPNTSGDVFVADIDKTIKPKSSMLVNIVKSSANNSNQLWSTNFRDPNEYRSMVVSGINAYILIASKNEGRVYNIDGTPYNGPIIINNLELK